MSTDPLTKICNALAAVTHRYTDTWMFITQSGITFEDFRDELRKININIQMHLYLCAYSFCIFHSPFAFVGNERNAVDCQMSKWKENGGKHTANCHFPTTKATTPIHFVPPKAGSCHLKRFSRLLVPHSWAQ